MAGQAGEGEEAGRHRMVLARHGETAWTLTGQHTSRTDVPLTPRGIEQAERIAARLVGSAFAEVLTSPLRRAADTCAIAGFADRAVVCDDVTEWDYGELEGRTTKEIRVEQPGWSLWRDGVPGGETAAQVAERADRVIARAREASGATLVFSHGHFLRVLAARWLSLPPEDGGLFLLRPGAISALDWEREQPVLGLWNETG